MEKTYNIWFNIFLKSIYCVFLFEKNASIDILNIHSFLLPQGDLRKKKQNDKPIVTNVDFLHHYVQLLLYLAQIYIYFKYIQKTRII